jgi:hypothetical protein
VLAEVRNLTPADPSAWFVAIRALRVLT